MAKAKKKESGFFDRIKKRASEEIELFKKSKPGFANADNAKKNPSSFRKKKRSK